MPRRKKIADTPTPEKKAPKQPAKSVKVNEAWNDLLVKNEQVSKAKKMTDDDLYNAMCELFPDKADKTTLTRVSMVRSCYNKGTNMFSKYGPPDGDERPTSFPYDEDGNALEARTRKSPKKKAEGEDDGADDDDTAKTAKATKPAARKRGRPAKKAAEVEDTEAVADVATRRRRRSKA